MRITLIVLLLFAASAVADDVILKDGRVLSGKVVDEGKRYTVVDRDRKFAVRKLEVARVFSKPSFMDDYEARLEKLPFDDAEAIFEFGRWLAENEWASRAARAYEEVLELDPDHRGARRALGYKLYEGEWVGPEELNRRKGLVKFEGRWYTKHDL
ncbi:MAG: tetratricopeptide repeat protein, partial [Planctomycetota bacterium]